MARLMILSWRVLVRLITNVPLTLSLLNRPYLVFYSVERQTILLVNGEPPGVNGLSFYCFCVVLILAEVVYP